MKGSADSPTSGRYVDGLRIIDIASPAAEVTWRSWRGDYLVFRSTEEPIQIQIPLYGFAADLTSPYSESIPVKTELAGKFPVLFNGLPGILEVQEFSHASYTLLSTEAAAEMIQKKQPFLLDVRTPQEFASAHIPGAQLIPIQELQKRSAELDAYRSADILVYCRIGNRSTSACVILIDNGFKRLTNLEYGIEDWIAAKHSTV